MLNLESIDLSLKSALDFISTAQEKDGSFPTLTSTSRSNFNDAISCKSNFASSIISLSLSEVDCTQSKKVMQKIAAYLLMEKGEYWTFNYWSRRTKRYKTMPYPDDLDDTSCALAAILKSNRNLIDGKALAKISLVLTNLESKVGGPYKTWLVASSTEEAWKDIDLAVNANIAYFLSQIDIALPNLNKYIINEVKSGNISSPYYPTIYPIFYFISRSYNGKNKRLIIAQLLELRKKQKINNALDMALFALSCMNLGHYYPELQNDIEFIISKKSDDGSWPAYAFYSGVNPSKKKAIYYEGSPALTTAFCAEALSKLRPFYLKDHTQSNGIDKRAEKKIKNRVLEKFKGVLEPFDPNFQSSASKLLKGITSSIVGDQILLLPYYFRSSLSADMQLILNDDLISNLGFANLLGWIAYTIYDDFFDEEGDRSLLPLANASLRKLVKIFCSISTDKFISKVFEPMMDRLDNSNLWEIDNCALKIAKDLKITKNVVDFGPKAINITDKSIGHILGPLYILNFLGFDYNSTDFANCKRFLTHYLAAKQLNDDAHDWEEDLRNRKGTAVTNLLFMDIKEDEVTLDQLDYLKKNFWYKTIPRVCNLVKYHLDEATKYLNEASVIKDKTLFLGMIDSLDKVRLQTLKERRDVLDFIKYYK